MYSKVSFYAILKLCSLYFILVGKYVSNILLGFIGSLHIFKSKLLQFEDSSLNRIDPLTGFFIAIK